MIAMKKADALHEQAMAMANEADRMCRINRSKARDLYLASFRLERGAALVFLRKPFVEPTRSILFRSAASLAISGGDFVGAGKMVPMGSRGIRRTASARNCGGSGRRSGEAVGDRASAGE